MICLASEVIDIDWEDILKRLSSYKGTMKVFCEENNVSVHQLYYQRRKIKTKDTPVFHTISFKGGSDKPTTESSTPSKQSLQSVTKIEIGKANIYIKR